MAYDFTSAHYHLQTLLQRAPKGRETADHLRAFRARLHAEADRIETEAKTAMVKAKAEADKLRAQAADLPPDFEGKTPSSVADYATYGSPEGHTPNGLPNRQFTKAELHNQFLRAANLIEKGE